MFKPKFRTLFIAGLLLITCNISVLFAQNTQMGRQQMESEALALFQKGEYDAALELFRTLMIVEPADPMHPYHAGICLVELNRDLADAIEYLIGASNSGIPGVPGDVTYYLGLAYHRNYNFLDAKKYFGRFELEADKQELKEYNLDHLIATCTSASEITASYNPFEVLNVTFINLRDSAQYSQVKMKGGRLQQKPSGYYGPDEEPDGLTSLAFVPRNPVKGDYIYYSGYGKNQKEGIQLFRIKKGNGSSWGNPEEIKALNSKGDDLLPYFDPIENDLYFASDGRLGIGGLDLYRSHYDSERDRWSKPVNLGFPVNSAMDEYLLLPGSDLGMVMFFSNRQSTDSSVAVYRLHLAEPKRKTEANNSKMIREIAQLGEVAEEILAELDKMQKSSQVALAARPAESVGNSESKAETGPVVTQVSVVSESKIQARYRHILSQAMKHEAASDSLLSRANQTRTQIRDSDDPNDRWVWQKQIMLWEKKSGDEKEIADELYAMLDQERATNQARVSRLVPEAIEVDTVMGDLTVYRYKANKSQTAGIQSSTNSKLSSSKPPAYKSPASRPKASKPIPDGIEVLDRSPYSLQNPIPMNVPLPAGVFYKLQLGSFATAVEPEAFQGISPISGVDAGGSGRLRYFAGKFRKYEDASVALSMIRDRGYADAFIVAWYNGNIVSTQRAKELE
jgi:tetratricopeptide (TPR) repeat protein